MNCLRGYLLSQGETGAVSATVEIHGERAPSTLHALEITGDVSPGGNKMGEDKFPPLAPPYSR